MLPSFWDQPKNRLQVEAPFFGRGQACFARSATPPDRAKAYANRVVETHQKAPATASPLGCPEASATLAAHSLAAKGSRGAHDYPVVAALEIDRPPTAAFLAWAAGSATGADRALPV
jgi:hypothetical protein